MMYGINISKKMLKIIVPVLLITLLLVAVVLVFIQTQKEQDNSTITSDHYYVEKGLESYAKIIKPAVESFLTQDKSESSSSRTKRLEKYFYSDSPVYGYNFQTLSPLAKKSTAKLTAVYSPDSESDDFIIRTYVSINFEYTDNTSIKTDGAYWVALKPDTNGKYTKVQDIGMWK